MCSRYSLCWSALYFYSICFKEPPRPPTPPPTSTIYHRKSRGSKSRATSEWSSIDIQLVGHHVLWAQHLWNAAIILADFLDENSSGLCKDKYILELGAGGALPSLVAALCGARKVVITDYPDAPLVENISRNVERNVSQEMRRAIDGYVWGTNPRNLFESLESDNGRPLTAGDVDDPRAHQPGPHGFDVIILSDLIFNHSQHAALLDTCKGALRSGRLSQSLPHSVERTVPCVLVFFSHHRPQYAARDLGFFSLAKDRGWNCKKVVQTRMEAMFPNDPGDEEVRSTVHGWILRPYA
ncbi:hypothetical protein BDV93DRAFT_449743 [Ceratobasidium sp. AG-I]|nr:hypothetical protein BDV93DRAFT_449743 [Ceratobasidium sp. AG-I]